MEFDVSAFVVFSLHLFPLFLYHIICCFFIIFSWRNSELILDYFLYLVYYDDIRCTLCVSICFCRWCWYSLLSQFFSIQHFIQIMYIYMFLYSLCHCCQHLVEWNGKWKNENGKTLFFSIFVTVVLFSVTDFYCFQQYVLPFFLIIIIVFSISIISFSIMCLKEMLKHFISLFFINYDFVLLLESPLFHQICGFSGIESNWCCYGCCANNTQERLELYW